jgi:hypothetical protein
MALDSSPFPCPGRVAVPDLVANRHVRSVQLELEAAVAEPLRRVEMNVLVAVDVPR